MTVKDYKGGCKKIIKGSLCVLDAGLESAPFASWILQRQLTEMKEAAVTAMRHVGELADLVRFLPGFFGSITSHVKKRTSRAPEMGHFAAYKPHCGVFVVLVGCIKLLTTAALTENGRARRGFGLFAWF